MKCWSAQKALGCGLINQRAILACARYLFASVFVVLPPESQMNSVTHRRESSAKFSVDGVTSRRPWPEQRSAACPNTLASSGGTRITETTSRTERIAAHRNAAAFAPLICYTALANGSSFAQKRGRPKGRIAKPERQLSRQRDWAGGDACGPAPVSGAANARGDPGSPQCRVYADALAMALWQKRV